MEQKHQVTLTDEERAELGAMVSSGKSNARKLVRARILLLADQTEGGSAKSDPEIADALGGGRATVERVRQQFVEERLEESLKPSPSKRIYERNLDS